ncbi:WD40 repeat protein [Kibdelosporangium banguiense]|uniref:WD40 repeat protein n=1 Tax=Kibdelosporangium banguiense TaxID=1365924 RepID=A0ABS4TYY0_9PSEU|nr:PD40 domain-containing protein [Kibdelosporangium banguiense]MBP2329609.1 WD40 repeat protein [Kibdelosporangium banguiense]
MTTLWDTGRRQPVGELNTRGLQLSAITFSPDGRYLAGARADGVTLWDLATHARIAEIRGGSSSSSLDAMAFSADGNRVVTADRRGSVFVWDVSTRSLINTFTGHRGQIAAMALSPDGHLLATAGDEDNNVTLWDVATGTRWATLSGHTAPVTSASFGPDGSVLLTGSQDQAITPWMVRPDQAARRLCDTLTNGFASVAPIPPTCR